MAEIKSPAKNGTTEATKETLCNLAGEFGRAHMAATKAGCGCGEEDGDYPDGIQFAENLSKMRALHGYWLDHWYRITGELQTQERAELRETLQYMEETLETMSAS